MRFQLALPRRERLSQGLPIGFLIRFQLALPRRERPDRNTEQFGITGFNSRSREGSDLCSCSHCRCFSCFNSRSREGSDTPEWVVGIYQLVSTRAPAKGATHHKEVEVTEIQVSTRAPAKGATPTEFPPCRPHAVSTRAPAKGATTLAPCVSP